MTDLIARLRESLANADEAAKWPHLNDMCLIERDDLRAALELLDPEPSRIRAAVEGETERCAGIVKSVVDHNAHIHTVYRKIELPTEAKMADGVRKVCERIEAAIRARTP